MLTVYWKLKKGYFWTQYKIQKFYTDTKSENMPKIQSP